MHEMTATPDEPSRDPLFRRIYGCEAAGTIANAMGDVVEGMSWQEIEQDYGLLETLLPQDIPDRVLKPRFGRRFGPTWVKHAHHRPPGTTEDGFERHRLCTSAILKKSGRINIEDLARTWVEEIDPTKFGYLMGNQDRGIYEMLKAGMPPWEVGRYANWPGFIGTSKMIMPVGMVNACRPDDAARDALDLGRLKDAQGQPGNFAVEVCSAIAAATAEALRPRATVDSVIEVALKHLPDAPRAEVEMGLGWTREVEDWKALRPRYAEHYAGKPISNAVEVLSGGLAIFKIANGQVRDAIVYAVNFGRDTDCKAYVAGGLAGALCGIDAIPADWVRTVETAASNDPHTVSRRTARQAAEGLYHACLAEVNKLAAAVHEVRTTSPSFQLTPAR